MQANGYIVNTLHIPPDTLSNASEGYVNDDEDISKWRSNHRQSPAPSDASEAYMDMSGRPPDMTVNSAYNTANTPQVPREDPPSYEYITTTSNLYEDIPGRVYTVPPQPPVPSGRPSLPVNGRMETVEGPKPVSAPQRKILCSFWQGRTEIGLRATILILELLMLSILIAAFVNWNTVSIESRALNLLGASLTTGFIACPIFFFMIIVTLEEIAFLALRLCTKAKNACTNCLLIWDIVNSTLVAVLFLLSAVGSAGVSVAWFDVRPSSRSSEATTEPQRSDALSGEIGLFIATTALLVITAILCIVKTVWIPVLTYRKNPIEENSS